MTNKVQRIAEYHNRTLPLDEARAYLDAPITDDEREHAVTLIRWFRRRYPTAGERLAYVRRTYERWMATFGIASHDVK